MTATLQDHPLRDSVAGELHARPYETLSAPVRISHISLFQETQDPDADRAHLADLCTRYSVDPPQSDANHFSCDLGDFRVRWERHTEFCTYTFFQFGAFDHPFENPPIDLVPADWLGQTPGQILAAAHVSIDAEDSRPRTQDELGELFDMQNLVGSRVAGGSAMVWSDVRLHEDRFARILVRDQTLSERQAGRLVQRVLEINAYRAMALLALPLARMAGPRIHAADRDLADVAGRMARGDGADEAGNDNDLLGRISGLAAEIEDIAAVTSDRFSAARAYDTLVTQRLSDLRQDRIEGLQTFSEFFERRMAPAMATCRSTEERQQALSRRAARVASLLRTQVEVALEDQNGRLLDSMNRRAKLQLRLQETVEGLSVVAITYYLVGLVDYGVKALEKKGLMIDTTLTTGLAVPIILIGVWVALRRMRKSILRPKDDGE